MVENRQEDYFNVCGSCRIHCCQDARPPVTERRRRIILEYIRQHGIEVEEPFVVAEYTFPREDSDGFCIFYDKTTKRCRIHPVKPETCVAGPITFDVNLKSGKIEWYLKKEEICPLAGIMFRKKELFEQHFPAAKREIRTLLLELPALALQTILKREEPETFKVGEDEAPIEVLEKLRVSVR